MSTKENKTDLTSSKKRKRFKNVVENGRDQSSVPQKKKKSLPLKGLVLAISTLDVKDKKHSSNDLSYQAVSSLCKELGAEVRIFL